MAFGLGLSYKVVFFLITTERIEFSILGKFHLGWFCAFWFSYLGYEMVSYHFFFMLYLPFKAEILDSKGATDYPVETSVFILRHISYIQTV